MSHRAGLIVLQAIGGLSIIPYPFVLLANIISIAAQGQSVSGPNCDPCTGVGKATA
jgi:hypothetical protein